MLYTIISKTQTAHHLLGYTYMVIDHAGEPNTFYGSEFERLLPGVKIEIGLKFNYILDANDNEKMSIISK